jgi:hypothetical protein
MLMLMTLLLRHFNKPASRNTSVCIRDTTQVSRDGDEPMTVRRNRDLEDERDIIPDGGSVHVPLMLRDHQPNYHQPGYHVADQRIEDVRHQAREAWIKDMTQAWKRPGLIRDAAEPDAGSELLRRRPDEPDADVGERLRGHLRTDPDDDAQAKRDAAWLDYKETLGRAWQTLGQTNPNNAAEVERLRRMVTNEPR